MHADGDTEGAVRKQVVARPMQVGATLDTAMKKPCADALLLLPHSRSPSLSNSTSASRGDRTIEVMIAT